MIGLGDQAVIVLCIDREHGRALGIQACIGGGQGSQEGNGCGRESGVMHVGLLDVDSSVELELGGAESMEESRSKPTDFTACNQVEVPLDVFRLQS